MNAFLTVGEVVKAQGVRGEVKLMPATPDAGRFRGIQHLYLQVGNETPKAFGVISARIGVHGEVYLGLEGVADRNAAEALRGAVAMLPREEARKLPEGEWYIVDLVGCQVHTDAGVHLGTLTEVLQHGAADVWVIDGPKPAMIPAVKKAIAEVDTAAKRIILRADELEAIAVYQEEGEAP